MSSCRLQGRKGTFTTIEAYCLVYLPQKGIYIPNAKVDHLVYLQDKRGESGVPLHNQSYGEENMNTPTIIFPT